MIKKSLALGLMIGAVSACTTEGSPPPQDPPSLQGQCDLRLQSAIGQPISSVRVPNNGKFRVIRPNDIVSMDYRPDRTNVSLDGRDRIVEVRCG